MGCAAGKESIENTTENLNKSKNNKERTRSMSPRNTAGDKSSVGGVMDYFSDKIS